MKRLAFLIGFLTAGAAMAQVTLSQVTLRRAEDATGDTYTFTGDQCNASLNMRWANNGVVTVLCSALRVWSTQGECGDAPGTGDVRYDDVPQLTFQSIRAGTFTLKIAELPGFANPASADGGVAQTCGSPLFSKTHRVCGSIDTSFNGCVSISKLAASGLKLVYDALPPGPPTMTEVTAQDEAVRVAFTVDSDTSKVFVEALREGGVDYVTVGEAPVVNAYVRGEGLENGVKYLVRLRAVDAAGNVSEPSDEEEVTPVRTLGFWGYYKDKGGTDGQGCSVGLGLVPLAAALLVFRRRQQKREDP
jgi:hypothetical protein